MSACLRALRDRHDVELLVYRWESSSAAPFDVRELGLGDAVRNKTNVSRRELFRALDSFSPDGMIVSGWVDGDYVWAARRARLRGVPVVAGSDAQWNGSVRQWAAVAASPIVLRSAFDVLWVSGERQRAYARKLGFHGSRCWIGNYACDWDRFARPDRKDAPRSFLFVGRYVEAKGIDLLVEAYRRYRSRVVDPWNLRCAGTGPLAHLLAGEQGVEDLGFTQPGKLPDLYSSSGVFVLPSRWEPWGVVLQEAAASSMALVASEASGAAVHLVQPGYSGLTFEAGSADDLAECLERMHGLSDQARSALGARAFDLSKQWTPARWADTLAEGLTRLSK
ncbi:MAG: glycosyltransferase family 4 protein [Deltaproteobacteria bacterium]|nr:glycosyltransferase family 4 protein [Deltaproteobacteria bacterium]